MLIINFYVNNFTEKQQQYFSWYRGRIQGRCQRYGVVKIKFLEIYILPKAPSSLIT